ncbi:hypothetical protein DY000_02010372 [Brassica cretica]|uniref:Uncharacterized protein n=1 Tax=Brassica cretica TaxID=69181 RepID=A0ABQ7CEC9_BRACR|nr:hypothetical protein DY000_02010372 [Brassica cretica]
MNLVLTRGEMVFMSEISYANYEMPRGLGLQLSLIGPEKVSINSNNGVSIDTPFSPLIDATSELSIDVPSREHYKRPSLSLAATPNEEHRIRPQHELRRQRPRQDSMHIISVLNSGKEIKEQMRKGKENRLRPRQTGRPELGIEITPMSLSLSLSLLTQLVLFLNPLAPRLKHS